MASCGEGSAFGAAGCTMSAILTSENFQPVFWASTTPNAAAKTTTVTICVLRSLVISSGSFLRRRRRWRRVGLADDREIEVAVLIHDHLADPGQDLLHRLGVESVAGDLRGLGIFGVE